jgi:hypothetical protein
LRGEGAAIDGHKSRRILATPVDAGRSQYKFLNYWVAVDVPVVLQVEMYDAAGVLVRILRAREPRRISGIWGARHLEMRSVQEGTKTVLIIGRVRLNTHPDKALFTPEALAASQILEGPPGDDKSE